jgi:hypothetical protein
MAMGLITPMTVAEKLAVHLQHKLSRDSLVAWADLAMMDGEFDPAHLPTIHDVVARIGVADIRTFGLTWEDRAAPRPARLFRTSQHRRSVAVRRRLRHDGFALCSSR